MDVQQAKQDQLDLLHGFQRVTSHPSCDDCSILLLLVALYRAFVGKSNVTHFPMRAALWLFPLDPRVARSRGPHTWRVTRRSGKSWRNSRKTVTRPQGSRAVSSVIRDPHRGHVLEQYVLFVEEKIEGLRPSLLKQRRAFFSYRASNGTSAKLRQVHPFSERNCLAACLSPSPCSTAVMPNPISRGRAQIFHSASLIYIRVRRSKRLSLISRERVSSCGSCRINIYPLRYYSSKEKVDEESLIRRPGRRRGTKMRRALWRAPEFNLLVPSAMKFHRGPIDETCPPP